LGALDFTSVVFAGAAFTPAAAFGAPAFAFVTATVVNEVSAAFGVVTAVFGGAVASALAGAVVAVGPCVTGDGFCAADVTGFCPATTGTTQAATAASEIRIPVDLVGCMLSLQREELSNRCSPKCKRAISLIQSRLFVVVGSGRGASHYRSGSLD
jgi:hypothetical protein